MDRGNRNDAVLSVKELSRYYWDGKRWIVSAIKDKKLVEQLFADYGSADSWCAEMKEFSPCISCLSSLLKNLNGVEFTSVDPAARIALQEELSYYPLSSASNELTLLEQLATGEFVPSLWSFKIHPLTSVKEYHVFTDVPPNDAERSKKRPYSIHQSFATGMETFNFLTRKFRDTSTIVTLVGVLHTIRYEGIKVLYSSTGGEINIEHDITDPISITLPVFTRYHAATKKLLFFDGALRRVLLKKVNERYNFEYFNFDIFKPGQSDK